MKLYYITALSMTVGLVIGAATIRILYAQNTPPVYLITEIDVTNPEGYQKEFLPAAGPTVKAHGGRTLAAGQPTSISGDPTKPRASILQFETMEQLQGWFNSPEYQAARAIGLKYAKYKSFAVPGVA